jgi:transposase
MQKTYTTMIQVQTLKSQGLSNTSIAARLGIHRQTVATYLKLLEQVRENGTPLASIIPQKGGHRRRKIEPYQDYILERLANYPELSAKRLYKEIVKQGFNGSYRTVRRYVSSVRPCLPQRVYKPYETPPGQQAQVDWGEEWVEWDGQKTKVYVFTFVLSYSRMRYVEYVTSLDVVTFLSSLHRAFQYIQGVPQTVLFDNAKTVVSERVGSTIRFQADLLQFAATMGFQPIACWVEDPESKGKVESTVKYVRRDFFYGSTFANLEELNRRAREWCEEVNREVHSVTKRPPYEMWQEEHESLRSLPQQEPTIFRAVTARVNKACLFSFEGNQYSVPKEHARKTIRLEIYEREFRAFSGQEEIARWPRTQERGKRFLEEDHYSGRLRGKKQSVLEQAFLGMCEEAKRYLEGLVEHRGTSLREQMEKIVGFSKECTAEELARAMERAIGYGSYGYDSLKRIVTKLREAPESLPQYAETARCGEFTSPVEVEVETRELTYYAEKGGAEWTPSRTA